MRWRPTKGVASCGRWSRTESSIKTERRATKNVAIHYRRLGPDTIAPLQDCIRRIYGDSYPYHWFYDGGAVEHLLDEGQLISVIALNDREQVIGTMGMLLASPHNRSGDYSADSIAAMVDEDYRGHGVMMQLGAELSHAIEQYRLAGIHLYALALHDVVQRRSVEKGRAAITGILPAYFNRDVRIAGFETGRHRIGAVVLFQPLLRDAPERVVHLPAPYAEVLRAIYDHLPLRRRLPRIADQGRDQYQPPELSRCELNTGAANCDAKLRVLEVGEDLGEKLAALERQMAEQKLQVLYVDFPLDDGAIEVAVAIANAAGFCFGALIPERHHTDWLRLQYYAAEDVSLDAMVVATEAGKRLLRFVGEDKARLACSTSLA